ncbi:TorF family putative porin [Sphingomonas sp. 1P06PA]|uniref:TorF family putative porin n=1 Tax=Sphingomonas sp. 1P06PA TaxID=554121 RepID=UPI0039A6792D
MIRAAILSAGLASAAAPAAALDPAFWIDAATDLRERGLSQSGGRAAVEAGVGIGTEGPTLDIAAATVRGSPRHGGADLRATVTGGYTLRSGGSRLRADVRWQGFAGGRGPLDYWEGGVLADTLIGPITLAAGARYAPRQRAIGGSLLNLRLAADGGLPGSPWSLAAHIGRTSGETHDPLRAARLRPDPTYLDWAVGIRRVAGPALLSLTYSDTDVAKNRAGIPPALRADSGATVVARVGLSF